jgi:hypothetical protein
MTDNLTCHAGDIVLLRAGGRRPMRRPHPPGRHDPRQHAVPLVAMSATKEVTSRSWYDHQIALPREAGEPLSGAPGPRTPRSPSRGV